MFNYQITYDINSASVYDDNYVIHFNFDSQEIIINDNKYNMYEIPLKYANLLLPIWYQVILGMDGFKPITIIKVYNCYLSYEFKTKENNIKNQSDFNIKESNFKIKENYDDLKIPDMIHSYEPGEVIQEYSYILKTKSVVIQSTYKENPIKFIVYIEQGRIKVIYLDKSYSYSLDDLPKKYYIYILSSYFNVMHYIEYNLNNFGNCYVNYTGLKEIWSAYYNIFKSECDKKGYLYYYDFKNKYKLNFIF